MTEDQKRMYDKRIEHGDDMTYENEGNRDMSPMVRISLKAVSYTHLTLPTTVSV